MDKTAQEPVGKWESKCKCDFRTKLVGDGCMYCNTQEYIEKLDSFNDELLKENEQLITRHHQFQALTDDEIDKLSDDTLFEIGFNGLGIKAFARAIEQASAKKNGFEVA